MSNLPKKPLKGKGSESVEVSKTVWNSTPKEHREVRKIRGIGGWYKEVFIISPEAFKKHKGGEAETSHKSKPVPIQKKEEK